MDKIFDEQRNVPFYGTKRDLEVLTTLVSNCLKVLDGAKRVRKMVLETWLTVDYAIRQFLLSGFELSRFCDDGFDLQYKLLPREFSSLLELLKSTVQFNANFPLEPEPSKSDRAGGFMSSGEFWRFVEDRSPELLERIDELTRQYVLAKNTDMPADVVAAGSFFFSEPEPQITMMNLEWRRVACALDEEWFRSAEQLNRARNKAAHSFRSEDVSRELGLAGPDIVALTMEKCLQIIRTLLGVREGMARE